MNLLTSAPQEVKLVVLQWLVPLFLLYNIVGWVGLPGREAGRSTLSPNPEESGALGKSIFAAWWLGVFLSLVGITAVCEFWASILKSRVTAGYEVVIAVIVGIVLGAARGVIPRLDRFHRNPPLVRRRILAFLVACAVGVSITGGVLYYNSLELVRTAIASFYAVMFIGYAATFVFEVGQ